MDNQYSQPAIQRPALPPDFEAKAGTSKSDLANAILDMIAQAKITGIVPSEPSPYDLAALTSQVDNLQKEVDKGIRKVRRVTMQGVNNGLVVVPFQDIGTNNYEVELAYLTPNVNFDPIQWSIIEDSKKSNQVELRLDGRSGAFSIEVTITAMDGI